MSRDGFLPRQLAPIAIVGLAGILACSTGCGAPRRAPVSVTWVMGREAPRFDPLGPPDPVRWSLERLLSRGLVEEDASGRIVAAAAESVRISADSLVYTFRLRDGLTFADGRPCGSEKFRSALEQGIGRIDHGTHAWLLSALAGMEKFRAGRPLPDLGLATPDPKTLVLRLSRPDSLLLRKLALPGVATPWSEGEPGGGWRDGIGDYRVVTRAVGELGLARRGGPDGAPDTIRVRFVPGRARAGALLREGTPDLLWPIPAGLLSEAPPAGYRVASQEAWPQRRLLLVLRADLPPTSKAAARHALAHALNRSDLVAALGASGGEMAEWLAGGEPFDFPKHDPNEVQAWLERSGIVSGPLFRRVGRDGRPQPGRLSDRAVALIVKRAAAAGGLDPARYAGQSLRSGLAVAAAAVGASAEDAFAAVGL